MSNTSEINDLAHVLNQYKCVIRYNTPGENEGGTLAHGFLDLQDSFQKFATDLLPRLSKGKLSEQEAFGLLHEIGEVFRHIDYHLHDSRFYSYLWPVRESSSDS